MYHHHHRYEPTNCACTESLTSMKLDLFVVRFTVTVLIACFRFNLTLSLNKRYGSYHTAFFLAKFHCHDCELNSIERIWARVKCYVRKYTDGTYEKLKELVEEGLSEKNIPFWLIRKYMRSVQAYLVAYRKGHNLVQADKWIRKQRSHRSFSKKMDKEVGELGKELHVCNSFSYFDFSLFFPVLFHSFFASPCINSIQFSSSTSLHFSTLLFVCVFSCVT